MDTRCQQFSAVRRAADGSVRPAGRPAKRDERGRFADFDGAVTTTMPARPAMATVPMAVVPGAPMATEQVPWDGHSGSGFGVIARPVFVVGAAAGRMAPIATSPGPMPRTAEREVADFCRAHRLALLGRR